MEVIRGLINLKPKHRGAVVTMGNFDGVHKGHQAILTKVNARAMALGAPSMLVCFEPQPKEFFDIYNAPARLCLLYTSPSPRDVEESRMPSSA